MRTVILVPRRGGGWRDQIWDAIKPDLKKLGYEMFTADSDTDIFAITQAWNNAARKAGKWDKAILHLADQLVVTPESYHEAVNSEHPGIVWCWDRAIRLNETGNKDFIRGKRDRWHPHMLRRRQLTYPLQFPHTTWEGPRVVTREMWETVGGFDERSYGWGAEDQMFSDLCERVHPARRVKGDMVDLWHPKRGNVPNDPYYAHAEANRQLLKEIRG